MAKRVGGQPGNKNAAKGGGKASYVVKNVHGVKTPFKRNPGGKTTWSGTVAHDAVQLANNPLAKGLDRMLHRLEGTKIPKKKKK
jgi:hypothetical protein